ncbi:phosphoglucosamine mutase [Melghirimyces profundicolus]|uniref:Phosphoglucosamine mutase n=1 Tax=Melghirimyces profundicolus TaxID=1242148 RepID=A0A2T6BS54_9BACL|nr:phosphoglucosamine mutase [Melghirimyces profundicolus]PTX58925.1 phosphoglucosamine mutase [Melghirimyces profundicolus]
MGKYFGTDGVRGVANRELTPELAYRLGRAGAYVLTKNRNDEKGKKPRVLVGRDTRLSGELLESALVAGMLSIGVDVARLGVVSTPGVAYLTREWGASAGVMISASHNPFTDNGIKFFGHDGFKLTDELEKEIEDLLDQEDRLPRPEGEGIGRSEDRRDAVKQYLQHLQSTIQTDLCGMDIVVDCANGAASNLAPTLLRELGADVTAIHADPDGVNINVDCGSTHPESLRQEVLQRNAHLGLAFDGDADRLIAVDEEGQIVDGDHILLICGSFMKEVGELTKDTIVTTVMSNIGLYKAAESMGIRTEKTKVGDRYVMEEMRRGGFNLGGEQSGHVIFLDHNTTGDGMLTALQLLRVVKEKATTLNQLAQMMTKYPQILVNVRVKEKNGWEQNEAIRKKIDEVEQKLGNDGRVLVRPSGTEPLIRVMAEGPDEKQLESYVNEIAEVVRAQLS